MMIKSRKSLKMAEYKDDDFLTLYPGVYTDGEKELFKAYLDECEAIEKRGTIDVQAMINGTLPEDTPGFEKIYPVPEALVKYQNARIDPENRLINDADYAKQMGYKNLFALPTFAPHSNVDKAFPPAARDTILANQLNGNITSYLPIYPGDTLYLVINKRTIRDITPAEGDKHRFLAISGEASLYNQNGEKVNDMVWNICEGVDCVKAGDRVAVGPPGDCGKCYACNTGHPNICANAFPNTLGIGPGTQGAYAEYVLSHFPQNELFHIQKKKSICCLV